MHSQNFLFKLVFEECIVIVQIIFNNVFCNSYFKRGIIFCVISKVLHNSNELLCLFDVFIGCILGYTLIYFKFYFMLFRAIFHVLFWIIFYAILGYIFCINLLKFILGYLKKKMSKGWSNDLL